MRVAKDVVFHFAWTPQYTGQAMRGRNATAGPFASAAAGWPPYLCLARLGHGLVDILFGKRLDVAWKEGRGGGMDVAAVSRRGQSCIAIWNGAPGQFWGQIQAMHW